MGGEFVNSRVEFQYFLINFHRCSANYLAAMVLMGIPLESKEQYQPSFLGETRERILSKDKQIGGGTYIFAILGQTSGGVPGAELFRQDGMRNASFYIK